MSHAILLDPPGSSNAIFSPACLDIIAIGAAVSLQVQVRCVIGIQKV